MRITHRLMLVLVIGTVLGAAWLKPLDAFGLEQVNGGLQRALASFAVARTLNAVISAAQGTEVGVGVVFAPGQLLDPVNDMVEQFSTLMLFASASFGIQRVLIDIGGYWVVSLLLTVVALFWAIPVWRGQQPRIWLTRVLVGLLLVRFAVPIAALASDATYRLFLAERYVGAQQSINDSSGRITVLSTSIDGEKKPPAAADDSSWSLPKNWGLPDWNIKKRVQELKLLAENAVEQLIDLIVVFVLQTLILPVLFLWLMLTLARGVFSWRAPGA